MFPHGRKEVPAPQASTTDEVSRAEGLSAGIGSYLALNVAGRFSTYAASPSLASSLWKSTC